MRRLPPPTPAAPAALGAIRGAAAAHARQPSPFQTPDCTTRTLAFDSAVSSAAADDAQLRRKRKRRIDEAAAFITTRSRRGRRRAGLDSDDSDNSDADEEHGATGTDAMSKDVGEHATPENDSAHSNQRLDRTPAGLDKAFREKETPARPESPVDADAKAHAVDKLRRLVRSCSARHHAAAALFYADKLIALSPRSPSDVLLFADACFSNQQYHRAIHAIKIARLVVIDGLHGTSHVRIGSVTLRAALLLGQCMLAIKQKEECLDIITKVLPEREQDIVALARRIARQGEGGMFTDSEGSSQSDQDGINLVSSLALLIGETYEALGNRENATLYFRISLRCDVYCAEAFFHLFDKQMLSAEEEGQLVESLNYSEDEMGILHALYQIQVGKYDSSSPVDAKFAHVEGTLGLQESLDLSVVKAETLYYQHDIQRAHSLCQRIRERDPFNFRVITVFVATLVELGKKRELYHYAHQMVDVYPKKASAWYTVGCYYLLIEKFEAAQRYFHKSTSLEPTYAPAWIGFGNSFAAQDESDQAMSSYRTASSLFPGSHFPPLYIGMEYLRTNNLLQAEQYIRQAAEICPTDPLIYNELGTVYYKKKEFAHAVDMFVKALELSKHLPERLMDVWEPTLFNLGNSYRKLRMFDEAIHSFQCALRLSPRNTSVLAALGFTYHMKGDLELAIESYHAALAYNPEDSLAGSMITVAFEESLSSSHASFARMTLPTRSPARVRAMRREPPSAGRGAVAGGSRLESVMEDSLLRRLDLDQSYSSIERSRQSLAVSSLDFSDDSSMNMEED